MINKLLITLLLGLLVAHSLLAQDLSQTEADIKLKTDINAAANRIQRVFPGSVLHLKTPKFDDPDYWVKLGQTRGVFIQQENFDEIYLGIDITTIPGEYLLAIESKKKQLTTYKFVVPTPKKPAFINLPSSFFLQAPLSENKTIINSLLWSNVSPKLPLQFPIEANWSNTVGYFYEQSLGKFDHKRPKTSPIVGVIDHVATTLTSPVPVLAPSDAVCFSITFDPTEGYSVVLDHGMGLFSEISGLSNLSISEQDRVKQGAAIASFNTADFIDGDNKPNSRTVRWRTFLNKSIVNPYQLTQLK